MKATYNKGSPNFDLRVPCARDLRVMRAVVQVELCTSATRKERTQYGRGKPVKRVRTLMAIYLVTLSK